ncbi:MAG: asparagine synthase C-terminal domain-containing protein [Thermoplasmata archaeon]
MHYFDINHIKYEDILQNLLMNNIPKIRDKIVGVLFSGGIDSTIILSIVKEHYDVIAYTGGFYNSKDIKNSIEIIKELKVDHKTIFIDRENVLKTLWKLINRYRDLSIVELSYEIPFYIVLSNTKEKNIFTGQGADELFGGYAKYLNNPHLMEKDIIVLIGRTIPREMEIARSLGKSLHTPFISPETLKFSMEIPLEEKIGDERKIVLRKLANRLNLPSSILNRKKVAMQYGTGVMNMLKKIAKDNGISVKDLADRELVKRILYNEAII